MQLFTSFSKAKTLVLNLMQTSFLALLFSCHLAHAGTSCKSVLNNPKTWEMAAKKGVELKRALDNSHAQVAIIARVGSDISKYGLYYSHAAFAVKDLSKKKSGWTVIHELNRCGTSTSALHAEGLMNFFLEDLFNDDFEVIVPTKGVQAKLYQAMRSNKIKKLHETNYSMLAYPFSTEYQNSNQWVLEATAAVLSGQDSRSLVQAYLKKTGYQPSTIHLVGLQRLGANFKNNVKFNDHPIEELKTNRYSVVTVDSVASWLKKNHWLQTIKEYRN